MDVSVKYNIQQNIKRYSEIGVFVSKTAETLYFMHFPLVFSRKGIAFVV